MSRVRGARFARVSLVLVMLAGSFAVATKSGQASTPAQSRAERVGCPMTRTGEYQRADPAAAGLDPAMLQAALDYADLQSSLSIKVFRHGCLLGEGARDPLFERVPANNYGQTKAVAALVTGIAQDKGYLDIDAPIGSYLPADLGDAAHRAVTLRNLLQEASGIQVNNVRGLNFYADNSRPREFFVLDFDHQPGTYFEYDEIGPSVVTYVVQQAIWRHEPGVDFQEFAQRELFDQLGIPTGAYFWQRDRAGNTEGYSQLFLRPLEFGRLGQLWLTGGVYQGRRVISERFIREFRTPSTANCGFGFFVWLNSCRPGQPQANIDIPIRRQFPGVPWVASAPADMVFSVGLGTRIFVIASLDLVVTRSGEVELDTVPSATMGNTDGVVGGRTGEEGTHEFFRLLMASVTNLPDEVRATIANSGPYDRAPEVGADLRTFLHPLDAAPGTFASIGPGAAEGCHPLGCAGEPNDGVQRYAGDVSRTVPGIVGPQLRPDGH
ncbi:MAG: serine hydrolase domain-containing protein [Pseudonocardiaceae bacterium]